MPASEARVTAAHLPNCLDSGRSPTPCDLVHNLPFTGHESVRPARCSLDWARPLKRRSRSLGPMARALVHAVWIRDHPVSPVWMYWKALKRGANAG